MFAICRHFGDDHSDLCEVIFHYSFDHISLIISYIEYLFMYHLWVFYEEMSLGLLPIFLLDCLRFCCRIIGAVCVFWKLSPIYLLGKVYSQVFCCLILKEIVYIPFLSFYVFFN